MLRLRSTLCSECFHTYTTHTERIRCEYLMRLWRIGVVHLICCSTSKTRFLINVLMGSETPPEMTRCERQTKFMFFLYCLSETRRDAVHFIRICSHVEPSRLFHSCGAFDYFSLEIWCSCLAATAFCVLLRS